MSVEIEAPFDLGIEHETDLEVASTGSGPTPIRFSRVAATAPDDDLAEPQRASIWQRSFPARRLLADVVVLGLIAVIAFALWPTRLGGATTYVIVKGTSMEPKFHTGDLAVVRQQDHYNVGDIVAYRIPKGTAGAGQMVIHRIIGRHHGGYLLQGDNRTTADTWNPTDDEVVGRFRMLIPIPGAGAWMMMPWVFSASIGISVVWILWPRKVVDVRGEHRDSDAEPDDLDPAALADPLFGPVTPVIVGQRRLRRLEREAAEAARRAERRAKWHARRGVTLGIGSLAVVIVAVAVTVFA